MQLFYILRTNLGTVPGPILFGVVFDGACTVWQQDCGQQGSCWIYDNFLLGRNLLILSVGVKCVSAIFFGISLALYKCPATMTTTQSTCQLDQDSEPEKTKYGSTGIDNAAVELDPYY